MKVQALIAAVIGALLVLAVGYAFSMLGSPQHELHLAIDAAHADEMHSLVLYLVQKRNLPDRLPATIADPNSAAGDRLATSAYTYRRVDSYHFNLCTTFLEAQPERLPWYAHLAGRSCLRFDRHAVDTKDHYGRRYDSGAPFQL